jgi:hypothetical protein
MTKQLEPVRKCPYCTEWCWDNNGVWTCATAGCGFVERRKGQSSVEPRFERRGIIASAWDKIGRRM